ncbi:MAG: multicopper oxidase domain-containing protein [Anaeromyxobacteraceae bacterium]
MSRGLEAGGARARSGRGEWVAAAVVALAVAAWEVVVDRIVAPTGTRAPLDVALSLAVDGAVALLLARAALELGSRALRRRDPGAAPAPALGVAAVSTVAFALLLVAAVFLRAKAVAALAAPAAGDGDIDALAAAPVTRGAWLCSSAIAVAAPALRDDLLAAARTALLLAPAAVLGFGVALALDDRGRRGRGAAFLAGACALGAAITAAAAARADRPVAPGAAAACAPGAPVRSYDVSAIPVDLTLDRYGDHDAGASLFVLDGDVPAVRARERAPLEGRVTPGLGRDAAQPLVVRANAGDCLTVRFTNRLAAPAAFHLDGLAWEAERAGRPLPPDAAAAPGETLVYRVAIPDTPEVERAYLVHDLDRHGDGRGAHGLFGAVVVEARGATWRDVATGAPLTGASWQAIVDAPSGAFREFVVLQHAVNGTPALNGRSEPVRQRFIAAGASDALAFSSYTYGDPSTPVLRSYLGEPTKVRVLHGGGRGQHAFKLHGGATRWERRTKVGPPLVAFGLADHPPFGHAPWLRSDAQALDPGDAFEAEMDCGAGGCQRAPGDLLLRCAVEGHAEAGEWGLWRVYDTLQPDLAPLPRTAPPPRAVTSRGLVGRVVGGRRVVAAAAAEPRRAEVSLAALVEAQLPPRGRPLHPVDATVWDWDRADGPEGPLYLGEPGPDGTRPPILFNPATGRYAWPLLRPHAGQRPPFAGAGHTPAPWRGEWATSENPGGVCPTRALVREGHRQRRVYSVAAVRGELLGGDRTPEGRMYHAPATAPPPPPGPAPRQGDVLVAQVFDCIDVLYVDDAEERDGRREHARPDLTTHFVKSDPQASDGVAAGFAFSQHAEPYRASGRTLARRAAAGDAAVEVNHARGLRPGVWIAVGLGEGRCPPAQPDGTPPDAPPADAERCTEIRRIAGVDGDRLALDAPLRHDHRPGEFADVEFVRFLWYSDGEYGMPLVRDSHTGLPGAARPRR